MDKILYEVEFGFVFWCPACGCGHRIWIANPDTLKPNWTWNGSLERPTFQPSYLIHNDLTLCHLYIKDGMIEYLADCKHEYAGKTIPMEKF